MCPGQITILEGACLSPVSLAQATFRVSSPMGCAPKPKLDSPRALPI